jgi:uncharacterized protein (DUF952 family)
MDEIPRTLCHVTTPQAVTAAGDALTGHPFLHLCTEAQLAFVLAQHFPGRTGLVVLRFDPATVNGRIEWERSEPDQPPFPHLYGTLPLTAVTTEQL